MSASSPHFEQYVSDCVEKCVEAFYAPDRGDIARKNLAWAFAFGYINGRRAAKWTSINSAEFADAVMKELKSVRK